MTALRAEEVSVVFGGRAVLDGVSLEVRSGEVLALIGPNGAGKSTLLAVLSGDQDPDAGRVLLDERPLAEWRAREQSRERAVLLQEQQVSFSFRVREVVEMGRSPWRRTPQEDQDDEAVVQAIGLADLDHLVHRSVPSLSGGERARTGFARVLAQRAGILLLDEPTAALDLRHQEEVLDVARGRARAGDAVVVVLHDLNLAAGFADRIVLMGDGRIVADGTPEAVLTPALLSAVYGVAVEVIRHPRTSALLVHPVRGGSVD